ncbi:MAG: hypothetical protein QN163_08865 [Armatimonadota bacterium]|nr:hypothetical protein [Armatimonadota bacterium]MDR5698112.1 hypothetical protein [Armatimonadota bacterium]
MERSRAVVYMALIVLLAMAALLCVALIVYGEWFDHRRVGAGALGVLLIIYSFVVLLFRKAHITAEE